MVLNQRTAWETPTVVDDAERAGTLYRQGRFAFGGFADSAFAGWSDGQTWNGSAKPFFERAEAERVIAWLGRENEVYPAPGFQEWPLPLELLSQATLTLVQASILRQGLEHFPSSSLVGHHRLNL